MGYTSWGLKESDTTEHTHTHTHTHARKVKLSGQGYLNSRRRLRKLNSMVLATDRSELGS